MGQRDQVLRVLAKDLRRYMEKLDIDYRLLQEIRIRADAPLMVVYHGKEYFVGSFVFGRISLSRSEQAGVQRRFH